MLIYKNRLVWMFALLVFIASALIFVGRVQAETLGFSLTAAPSAERPNDLTVQVVDDVTGDALEGAHVVVSDRLDLHTAGVVQHVRTNAKGMAYLARGRASLAQPFSITAELNGYVKISIAGARAAQATLFMKKLTKPEEAVIGTGEFGGWKPRSGDDTVMAGFVFKSLSAMDLLHFQFQSFISPLRDTIDVFGPRQIPSNLVLPEQRVFTLIGSITLNKPAYRLPVAGGARVRLAGLQGEAKVADLLPAFQGGKPGPELLNKLKFTRAGLTGTIQESKDFREDFEAVLDLSQKHEVTVNAPPFPSDVIVAAVTDLAGDRQTLIATDVKSAVSAANPGTVRTVRLSGPTQSLGQARDVVSVAVAERGKRLSGIVTDSAGRVVKPGAFLPVDEMASNQGLPSVVRLHAPANGMAAAIFQDAGTTLWAVYALPSGGEVDVPTSRSPGTVSKYSVNGFEMGSTFNESEIDGTRVMRKLERFTRTSAEVAPQP